MRKADNVVVMRIFTCESHTFQGVNLSGAVELYPKPEIGSGLVTKY
jgi:hypothetical protein